MDNLSEGWRTGNAQTALLKYYCSCHINFQLELVITNTRKHTGHSDSRHEWRHGALFIFCHPLVWSSIELLASQNKLEEPMEHHTGLLIQEPLYQGF